MPPKKDSLKEEVKVSAPTPKKAKESTNHSKIENQRRSRSKPPVIEEVVKKPSKVNKTIDKSKTPDKNNKSMKNG